MNRRLFLQKIASIPVVGCLLSNKLFAKENDFCSDFPDCECPACHSKINISNDKFQCPECLSEGSIAAICFVTEYGSPEIEFKAETEQRERAESLRQYFSAFYPPECANAVYENEMKTL